jgi:hypothetical protein
VYELDNEPLLSFAKERFERAHDSGPVSDR